MIFRFAPVVCLVLLPAIAKAEQPVFGMMPRWANGWGVQTQYEYQDTTEEQSHVLHLEGVYTWARWIRVTYKVPFVLEGRAAGAIASERGLGTPIVAMPLKKYFNHDGLSGSWSLTPHLFVPVATTSLDHSDEYGLPRRQVCEWQCARVEQVLLALMLQELLLFLLKKIDLQIKMMLDLF